MSTDKSSVHPACIAHWREAEGPDDSQYPGMDELMSVGAPIGDHLGLTRMGIHHERLPPGRRTSLPHAESAQEEFVFVLEGTPDVWLDGVVHRLGPGDAVGFPAGTGLAHTFINDSEAEVRLLVVGERNRPGNRVLYPLHPQARTYMDYFWEDAPPRERGPHDGMSAKVRAERARRT